MKVSKKPSGNPVGRPRKKVSISSEISPASSSDQKVVKRPRGRPREVISEVNQLGSPDSEQPSRSPSKNPVGRPRKKARVEDSETDDHADSVAKVVKRSPGRPRKMSRAQQLDPVDLVQKQLKRFKDESSLILLAQRLFQKDQLVLEEFMQKLSEADPSDQLTYARHYILSIIELALDKKLRNSNGDKVHFPSNAENYVSFCDLFDICNQPDRRQWFTFSMERQNKDLNILQIRKRVKKSLTRQDHVSSVQMEVKVIGNDVNMAFLRICSGNKTKNEEKDLAKLLLAKPTFIAFVPGENYFFVDKANPNEEHCLAFINALNCPSYESTPLRGRHPDGLRQLLLNRDQPDFIDDNPNAELPQLETFSVSATTSLKDDADKVFLENFKVTLSVHGKDVLNRLRTIAHAGSSIVSDPPPVWLQEARFRGRNHINIRQSSEEDVVMSHTEDENDAVDNRSVHDDGADDEQ